MCEHKTNSLSRRAPDLGDGTEGREEVVAWVISVLVYSSNTFITYYSFFLFLHSSSGDVKH